MDPNANNPPALSSANPPPIPAVPPVLSAPPSAPPQISKSFSLRRLIAVLLSLSLLLFVADAFVSLLDDSLIIFLHVHLLGGLRGIIFLFALLGAILIYGLIGLTPMVPKRFFVPVALFIPLAPLAVLPSLIYFYERSQWITWIVSLCQAALALAVLHFLRRARDGRTSSRESQVNPPPAARSAHFMPLVTEHHLNSRAFSWLNLSAFILINIFILLPAILAYLFLCASLAVGHLSQGFLALGATGFSVQVRKYVRDDGKTIQLVPMAHVGEPEFYRELTQSFPTNATILMEGVTDYNNLLTNRITYNRMATSLGLSEQQKEFKPVAGEWVPADIDVQEFAPSTIGLLNLIMRIHARGATAETVLPLLQYSPPADVQAQIWDDLLRKRNRHLLEELRDRLPSSDYLIIPWGAAHMPELSREIQKSGFHLAEARSYQAIRFGARKDRKVGH